METVLRVVIIYIFLLFGIRVMGKREFSQMSPLELIALLLIPELVSQAAIGEDFSVVNALIAVSTLLVLVFLNSLITHVSKKAESIVTASPTVLIHAGKIDEEVMNKERVTADDVLAEARKSGVEQVEDIRWALLERDGKISVVPEGRVGTTTIKTKQGAAL